MINKTLPKLIATSLGLGYSPFAPGTFGAIGGAAIVWWLSTFVLTDTMQIAYLGGLALFTYLIGVWATAQLTEEWGDDPSKVVMDETCGMIITMIAVTLSIKTILLGLLLFRIFDIAKPFGIKHFDNQHTPKSVMLDDVLAGVYANVTLQLLLYIDGYFGLNYLSI